MGGLAGQAVLKTSFTSFCMLFLFKYMRADIFHDFDFDIIQNAALDYIDEDTRDSIKLDTQLESSLMKSIVSKLDNDSLLKFGIYQKTEDGGVRYLHFVILTYQITQISEL